jgi:UDP-glucose 4-epimerase
LNRLGLRIPVEMLNQLRYGRGLDNRKLKASGYEPRWTSREAVIAFAEQLKLRPLVRSSREPYRYEREVEEFLRWSPSVRRRGPDAGKPLRAPTRPGGARGYDELESREIVDLLPSLENDDLRALRSHEASGARRTEVLEEIDRLLDRAAERAT